MSHDRQGTSRRRVLLGLGAGATIALAGCLGDDDGADEVPVRGDPDADIVLEAYVDMGCPGCRAFDEEGFDGIQATYLDDGLVRYEHRDLIVTGSAAGQAANAAREVYDRHGNDAFWEFKSAVYQNQERLEGGVPELFGEIAADLGFDADAIEDAGANRDHQSAVDADTDRGESIGIGSTPGFALDDDPITNPDMSLGQRIQAIETELDNAIAQQ